MLFETKTNTILCPLCLRPMPRFDLLREGKSTARHSDCASVVRNRHVDAALRPTLRDKLSLSIGKAGSTAFATTPSHSSHPAHVISKELQWNSP